jgi:hypothetical protein
MAMIEELGKVIAQMVTNRDHGAARKNPELIQTVYSSLRIEPDFLLNHSPTDIHSHLDGEDSTGLQRMEIAAKTLIEESYIYPERQTEIRLKAKELLEYVQQHDTTFSLDRLQLLDELAAG